jgi:hypothetical protein
MVGFEVFDLAYLVRKFGAKMAQWNPSLGKTMNFNRCLGTQAAITIQEPSNYWRRYPIFLSPGTRGLANLF